jgi:hypothetical protein
MSVEPILLMASYTDGILYIGALVGVYATSNRRNGTSEAYVSNWRYQGHEQYLD